MPIAPLIFKEKAMALRYHGNLDAAYHHQAVVFKANLAQRATADALNAAVQISDALERQLGRLTKKPSDDDFFHAAVSCREPWTFYCKQVYLAAKRVLDDGKWVLVITEPYQSDRHVEQQQAMVGMLREQFGGQRRLRYVNLGLAVDLRDRTLSFDGLHLTGQGNERIADRLLGPTLEVLTASDQRRAGGR
jgi:hypothetical protein